MQDLEVGATSREVKTDARRLLEDQKKLQQQLQDFQKQNNVAGKPTDELTPKQTQELEQMRDAQQKLEERNKQLMNKMEQLAEERSKQNDQQTANDLRAARAEAEERNLPGDMKKAVEQIKKNQLNDAQQTQKKIGQDMEKMVKDLEERREAELDRQRKDLQKAQEKLDELRREEEELQKKIKQAEKIADPEKRAQALQELEGQQRKMKQQAEQIANDLKRLRGAGQPKRWRRSPTIWNSIVRSSKRAKSRRRTNWTDSTMRGKEVERAQKEKQVELRREQLRGVGEALARLKERQEALNAEAARIQKDVQQWTRSLDGEFETTRRQPDWPGKRDPGAG